MGMLSPHGIVKPTEPPDPWHSAPWHLRDWLAMFAATIVACLALGAVLGAWVLPWLGKVVRAW